MESLYQILNWDTEFFGFKIAKIMPYWLGKDALRDVLTELRENQVVLAYWASDSHDPESEHSAKVNGGFLADKKVTYAIDLGQVVFPQAKTFEQGVEEYSETATIPALEKLAIQAGIHSRYNLDLKFPKKSFEDLYKLWIRDSVNKALADGVLVYRVDDKLGGIITMGGKNGRGDIGLLAVEESMRGMNIGGKLVRSAQNWFRQRGYAYGQVVTQGANLAGCRLYEKCGYHLEKTDNFYHFWIES